jgi:Domain of unknown function (DUF4157)
MTHQHTTQTKTSEHDRTSQASATAKSSAAPAMHPMLHLQQQVGNQAVGRLIQAKLTVGEPNDVYEQEADRVAAEVVSKIHAPQNVSTNQTTSVQRQVVGNDEKELRMKPLIQCKSDMGRMAVSPEIESSIQQARGSGQPLAESIRTPMEQAFGTDFSGVRVHTDERSDRLNREVGARAFTTGQDVFFKQGEYSSGSRGGQELLAHELTHVVQQQEGLIKKKDLDLNEKSNSIRPISSMTLSCITPKIQLKRQVTNSEFYEYLQKEGYSGEKYLHTEERWKKSEQEYDASKQRGEKLKKDIGQWKKATEDWWKSTKPERTKDNRKNYKKNSFSDKLQVGALPFGYKKPIDKLGVTLKGSDRQLDKLGYTTLVPNSKFNNRYKMATGRGKGAATNLQHIKNEDYPADYTNYYNPETGEFEAAWNMGNRDSERINNSKRAANSDIIWQQYKKALARLINKGNAGEEKTRNVGEEKIGNLKSIHRSHIINDNTNETLLWTNYGSSAYFENKPKTVDQNDEEFWAALGTDNANSAGHLLLEHGLSMGAKDIKTITIGHSDLKIEYDIAD